MFEQLVGDLHNALARLDTTFRLAIPVRQRVAVGLFFLAHRFTYHQVSWVPCRRPCQICVCHTTPWSALAGRAEITNEISAFRLATSLVGQSTVHEIVRQFVKALRKKYAGLVRFPVAAEECQAVAAGFEARKCLPNCLGAITCTRFKVRKPHMLCSEAYRDRTGVHSMKLQAFVDAHGNFLAMSCGAFGSTPDGQVYDDSAFSGTVREKRWLQTPKKRITYLSATTPPREVEYLLTPYILVTLRTRSH